MPVWQRQEVQEVLRKVLREIEGAGAIGWGGGSCPRPPGLRSLRGVCFGLSGEMPRLSVARMEAHASTETGDPRGVLDYGWVY